MSIFLSWSWCVLAYKNRWTSLIKRKQNARDDVPYGVRPIKHYLPKTQVYFDSKAEAYYSLRIFVCWNRIFKLKKLSTAKISSKSLFLIFQRAKLGPMYRSGNYVLRRLCVFLNLLFDLYCPFPLLRPFEGQSTLFQ